MSEIGIKCIDQVLTFTNMPIITAGDINVDKVRFDFCPLWDGFVKVAIFFQQKNIMSYSIVNADNVCDIPNSILKLEGNIYISVVGVNGTDQTRTANILSYNIGEGVVDAVKPEDFPGTEDEAYEFYNNILEMCSTMLNAYNDTLARLDNVYTKAETYSREETYSKAETYSKEETYSREETGTQIKNYAYSKAETDTKLDGLEDDIKGFAVKQDTAIYTYVDQETSKIRTEYNGYLADIEGRLQALEQK